MARFHLNILDFSGACQEEGLCGSLPSVTSLSGVKIVSCGDVEGTNCYCEDQARNEILRRFRKECPASDSLQVNWIDTGDYHHLSMMTVSEAVLRHGPLALIQIDHHPDMQEPAFGGILSCGGWLRNLLDECGGVEKAFVLGIDPELAVECGGYAERVSVSDEHEVRSNPVLLDRICNELRGRKVYLSIDKDVLGREWSRTDWDHGTMSLEFLESTVRRVASVSEIVGMDICGGMTSSKGGSAEDFAINLRTDLKLLEMVGSLPEQDY